MPNETLAKVQQRALEKVGGYTYTAEERAFAERLQKSDAFTAVPLETTAKVKPLAIGAAGAASTDVGDVSWVVPTVQLSAATWVPGTAAHSWQAVAAGGTTIGYKGMMVAAKTMALTGADLFSSPADVDAAKAELSSKRGPNFKYETALGDSVAAARLPKGQRALTQMVTTCRARRAVLSKSGRGRSRVAHFIGRQVVDLTPPIPHGERPAFPRQANAAIAAAEGDAAPC